MDEFLVGSVVAFGPEGKERVGIVIRRIQHHMHGDSYLMRTPTAIVKDQIGDVVPLHFGLRAATHDAFRAHVTAELARIDALLTRAVDSAREAAQVS